MNLNEYIEFNRLLSKKISRVRFLGWFIGLGLPFAAFLSLFAVVVNQFGGQLQRPLLFVWMAIAMIGFLVIQFVVYRKAIRPAALQAKEEIERRRTWNDA